MRFNDILKEIEEHTWWVEEAPCVVQTIIYELTCFVSMSRLLKQPFFSLSVMAMKGDYFWEVTPADERHKLYLYFFRQMKKNKSYISQLMELTDKKKVAYWAIFDKFKACKSNQELWKYYRKFMEKYRDWIEFNAAIECVDVFSSQYLEEAVRKELPELAREEVMELTRVMITPKELSFMEKERFELLEICNEHYDNVRKQQKTISLMQKLEQHSEKYYFVLSNFKTIRNLGAADFFEKCLEETQNTKQKLQDEANSLKNKISKLKKAELDAKSRYNMSSDLLLHFQLCEIFGTCIDKRKANMMKTNKAIMDMCSRIGAGFGITGDKVSRYTLNEIRVLILDGVKPTKELNRRKKEATVWVYSIDTNAKEGYNEQVFKGKDAEQILAKVLPKAEGEIKGHVASAPVNKIVGKVQIIFDTSMQEFEKGNILVTTMTRPDFVPLMRKAAAIVTDEGGLTCHAAIISRELGIPCIIGTRIATKALKDGDTIEMDLRKGVVRQVK